METKTESGKPDTINNKECATHKKAIFAAVSLGIVGTVFALLKLFRFKTNRKK